MKTICDHYYRKTKAILGVGFAIGLFPQFALAEESSEYRYNPGNLPDPFRPMQVSRPTVQSMSPLQDFNLEDLTLVGTMLGAETSALIVTPSPSFEGVIARVGDKIGRNNGRIVVIGRDRIVVRQPVAEKTFTFGGAMTRQKFEDITMPLVRKQPGVGLSAKTDDEALENTLGISSGRKPRGAFSGAQSPDFFGKPLPGSSEGSAIMPPYQGLDPAAASGPAFSQMNKVAQPMPGLPQQ